MDRPSELESRHATLACSYTLNWVVTHSVKPGTINPLLPRIPSLAPAPGSTPDRSGSRLSNTGGEINEEINPVSWLARHALARASPISLEHHVGEFDTVEEPGHICRKDAPVGGTPGGIRAVADVSPFADGANT